jgi:putative ABC transport system substrate-binding protein
MPRLGYLSLGPREAYAETVDAFLGALRDLGYVEGQTIAIEWRFAPLGSDAAWAELGAELVRLPVDLIVSLSSTTASLAAKAATSTIPIVVVAALPVETGLVASLSRPGGNITGVASPVGVNAKHLDLLRAVVPGLTGAAFFGEANNPANRPQWDEFRTAAETAGVQPQLIELRTPGDLEEAFDLVELGGAQALSVAAQTLLRPVRERVAELALQHRLPSITRGGGYAEAGLLMNYGQRGGAATREPAAAVYVGKISEGTRPADLPVELPTQYDSPSTSGPRRRSA